MTTPTHITAALDSIIKIAQSKGAEQSEALYSGGKHFGLKAEKGELGEYKVSSSAVVGVRIFKDQKVGLAYSEDLSPESLSKMVEQAFETLPLLPAKPFEKLICTNELQIKNEAISEEELNPAEMKKRIDFALKLESEILARDPRVKNAPYNGLNEVVSLRAMKNSLGASSFEKKKSAGCYTSALMEDQGKNAMYYHSTMARQFEDLNPEICVEESLKRAQDLLKGKSLKSGQYTVVLSPDLLASLFGVFSKLFSAKAMVEGTHPCKDRLGSKMAVDGFTLIDSPKAPENLYPVHFDDEGFPTQDTVLFEKGVFKGLLHNSATALELGLPHTPNASRGPRGPLSLASVHEKIAAGNLSEKEIFEGEVFEIIDMQGLHSGANSTTGDFSFAASGYFWQNGAIQQVVRGVTVSGNFYQALLKISGIGKELKTNSSLNFTAPLIRFEGFTTAGEA